MKSFFLLVPVIFFSCNNKPSDIVNEEESEEIEVSLESQIRHKIEASLEIQGNEKYTFEEFSAHCNSDNFVDKIIAINLLDRAKEKAIQSKNPNAAAQVGFMGNYNFIIFMNGSDTTFSEPTSVPSSAMTPLKISFENIESEHFKSIVVDAKTMNNGYRYFYFLVKNQPNKVLYVPIYENIGASDATCFSTRYETGTYSLAKNVLVMESTMNPVKFSHSDEVYSFDPKITSTDKLNRRWFYNNQERKYFTIKD